MSEKKINQQGLKNKLLPLVLLFAVILLDQLSKAFIVANVPRNSVLCQFFGDFLRIVHVRNIAVAFSMGHNLPDTVRHILFGLAPLIVLIVVLAVYFRNNDFSKLQRWLICGIVGGGFGNLIDRFFRKEGVVDFIDVKFYGIFGLERWPTFNIADSAIVICVIILLISFVKTIIQEEKNKEKQA